MELRQLRYFLKVIECGSLGKAALELGIGTSALSQQIGKLENELAVRLLSRTSTGAVPTSAGLAFMHHARLTLRQAEQAVVAAQKGRMSGHVSVGLAPTTASVLAQPLISAMRERYPDIQLHLVETLSGHLAAMLNARQLDLAVLFQSDAARRWSVMPLLDEKLFVIASPNLAGAPAASSIYLAELADLALIMPSAQHGLRASLMASFERSGASPNVVMEIDGLAVLMEAVRAGHGATIQPGAATARVDDAALRIAQIADEHVGRRNLLVSLSDDELFPSALAARVVIADVARELVRAGRWPGARLIGDVSR
ncbi:LysR family transcriptional regulator [Marinobacterium nitratireducens]|uniref:LysR family transcriptional regulator n=1 Tax=Marinobacterium nitratireducens TaxID=518897 RepID=A0A918DPQ0_9GAMM|nr:LysR substrate-binding domain-containing protein [Marinobacterium nitratireducens]GGO75948.1 LysR family transcriptional regulator [Marinobacterium nitratireducens]